MVSAVSAWQLCDYQCVAYRAWVRECIRPGCSRPAVATLTYVYAERTAVVGPLGPSHEPGAYDMCAEHAEALSRRWGGKSSACPVSTIQPQTHQPMI